MNLHAPERVANDEVDVEPPAQTAVALPYCARSATVEAAFSPVPVTITTVLSPALIVPAMDNLSSAAAALALVHCLIQMVQRGV